MLKLKPWIASVLTLVLAGLAIVSIYLVKTPDPEPASAPATVFSAERAMEHVRQIAKQPHAMGTPEHAKVRSYLLNQLTGMGLQPQVQEAIVANNRVRLADAGYVYNVMARLEGTGNGKAVLLMAHYDSQPNTPGAADDAAGVAAILETMRAIQQSGTLQNDVIMLFTDGEEYGLYGAQAFTEHPWIKDVGVVVNVEARGNSGPSMTFEISPENGWVIKQFAAAAPFPVASSLGYEVYRVLPNNTDFTVFRELGYTGMNSATIDGFVHYHKLTDSPENLNLGSLQHHGSNMLAMARHFGNIPLANTKAEDRVFFNPAGTWFVHYPTWLNIVLAIVTLGLLVAVVIVGLKKRAYKWWQAAIGLIVNLLIVAIIIALFTPVNSYVTGLLPYFHGLGGVYGSATFFVAYTLLAIGLFILLAWLVARWLPVSALMMGAYLLWGLLLLASLFIVPSVSYLFLFPLLFCLIGTLFILQKDHHNPEQKAVYSAITQLLALVPAILLLLPIINVLSVVFDLLMPGAMVGLLALSLCLALPLLLTITYSFRWGRLPLLPFLLLIVGGLILYRAIASEAPTPEKPLHSHISYYLNTDTNQAVWASAFKQTDDWNKQFLTDTTVAPLHEIYPNTAAAYVKSIAQPIHVQPPVAELVQQSITDTHRELQLQLQSPRGAAHMDLILQTQLPEDSIKVSLNQKQLYLKPDNTDNTLFRLNINGLPVTKQLQMQIQLSSQNKLNLLLYDKSIGLPEELVKQPRPAHIIPEQGRTSNLTVVRKSYSF